MLARQAHAAQVVRLSTSAMLINSLAAAYRVHLTLSVPSHQAVNHSREYMPCSLQTSVHGIANIIQVRSVDADFSWLSTPDAHIPICVCNLYLVITVRDVRV